MRESLVISQKVRTFAPVLKMVVIHSVRANGNRSLGKNAKVSLFYGQPDAHRCMPSAPVITAAIQKDFGALRGTAIFRTTGCAAVPLSNRLVKKATMQQEEIWKDKTCRTGHFPLCGTTTDYSSIKHSTCRAAVWVRVVPRDSFQPCQRRSPLILT